MTGIWGLILAFVYEQGTLDILFCRSFEPHNHVNNSHQRINSLDFFLSRVHLEPPLTANCSAFPTKYFSYITLKNLKPDVYRDNQNLSAQHFLNQATNSTNFVEWLEFFEL